MNILADIPPPESRTLLRLENKGDNDSLLGVVARNVEFTPAPRRRENFLQTPAGNDGFEEVSQAKMLRSFIKKR